ncbi:hypothetical protein TRFO_08898 [Tritrichomonas foetus]|uniref:BAR domain-containing protein n=1 Tax=Tritrichomonas foetus TaxID=1144522 RepID=A0A1J4JHY1_9EUKA|nr:hypothetical protein TRFO_08898 [Tritrichomonas foetus]|eukprot:OHS98329.1 hypothetical protein TRFO_08898 [Tritrichomonas foetus]
MRNAKDPAGQVVYNCIEVLEKFATFLKNDIVLIAEKERSLGYINESMQDVFTDLTVNQYPKAREVINLFISSLTQVEYVRKTMYSRYRSLAQNSFTTALELATKVKGLLVERENAFKSFLTAQERKRRIAQPKPQDELKLSQATTAFQTLNSQTIQAAGTFANQLHRDLVTTLSAFAHAQMELYAKSLEVWAATIEQIDQATLDDDTDAVVLAFQKAMNTLGTVSVGDD